MFCVNQWSKKLSLWSNKKIVLVISFSRLCQVVIKLIYIYIYIHVNVFTTKGDRNTHFLKLGGATAIDWGYKLTGRFPHWSIRLKPIKKLKCIDKLRYRNKRTWKPNHYIQIIKSRTTNMHTPWIHNHDWHRQPTSEPIVNPRVSLTKTHRLDAGSGSITNWCVYISLKHSNWKDNEKTELSWLLISRMSCTDLAID